MNITIAEANCNRAVMAALTDLAKRRAGGGEFVVIVPDSYTLTFERALMGELEASFSVSIVTFRRLLSRLLLEERRFLDATTGTMAVRAAVSSLGKELRAFGRSVKFSSFSEKMFELIASLKNCGITPEETARGAERAKGALRGKLSDISRIYSEYERIKEDAADSSDLFSLLPDLIEFEEAFRTGTCVFAGFDIFSKLGERVFLACARTFSETVFLANTTDKPQFAPVMLAGQIAGLLGERGMAFRRTKASAERSPFARAVSEQLFDKRRVGIRSEASGARFFAGTREEEVEYAARNIKELLFAGYRFSEIAVVLSDASVYEESLKSVFGDHEIAYWFDHKYRLAEHPLSKWLLGYLQMKERGWAQEDVLPFVKNAFFRVFFEDAADSSGDPGEPIPGDPSGDPRELISGDPSGDPREPIPADPGERFLGMLDVFENYVLKYGVTGKRFFSPFELGNAADEGARLTAELVRRGFVRAVNRLSPDRDRDTLDRFLALLDELTTARGRWNAPVLDLFPDADPLFCAFHEQVPDYLRTIFQNVRSVFGSPDDASLAEILKSGIEKQEISEIPLSSDCVFCGEKESVQYDAFRALFVLGMNEGEFPAVSDDGGMLNDRDIDELKQQGIRFYPKNSENNLRVRFSVLKLLTNDYERRFFSSTLALRPCEQFSELLALTGGSLDEPTEPLSSFSSETRRRKYAARMSRLADSGDREDYALYAAVCEYAEAHDPFLTELLTSRTDVWDQSLPAPLAEEMFYADKRTSISAVETYYRCPFRHFLQYGLRARERETAEMKALNIGNILHETLEQYIKDSNYEKRDAGELFDAVMAGDENAKYSEDERFRPIVSRLRTEAIKVCGAAALTLRQSEFRNFRCELGFGMNAKSELPAISLAGTDIRIKGKIDRVDVLSLGDRTLCRVIDYKSGRAKFEEDDLYFGHKVQLFVYLYALGQSADWRPAGAYYFPVHNRFSRETDPAYRLCGVTLADREVLVCSDFALGEGLESELIDVRLKGPDDSEGKNLLSAERMDRYVAYAVELCRRAITESAAGDVRMLPAEGSCSSCGFLDVCRNYEQRGARSASGWDKKSISAALAAPIPEGGDI